METKIPFEDWLIDFMNYFHFFFECNQTERISPTEANEIKTSYFSMGELPEVAAKKYGTEWSYKLKNEPIKD